jgi:YrbI family 3-deoxy-D-manno-octulosonate 8-phosphate phosphatase
VSELTLQSAKECMKDTKNTNNNRVSFPNDNQENSNSISSHIGSIDAIIFDFDGVFTDNRVIVFEDGREAVICNRSDGLGISLLKKTNIPMLVLSTEKNSVVKTRCDKLGLECTQGIDNKLSYLKNWLNQKNILLSNVIFIGNDINDLECLSSVGCGIAVADAYPEVLSVAKIVLKRSGGHGAIRELAELVIKEVSILSCEAG